MAEANLLHSKTKWSNSILGQVHVGFASITGTHYSMSGYAAKQTNWVGDWQSGNLICCSLLAAIHHRRKTGLGTMMQAFWPSQSGMTARFTRVRSTSEQGNPIIPFSFLH